MKNLTVLITAAGVPFMPGLVSCLRNNGERCIRIIGVDMSFDTTINQMVDVFYQVPKVTAINYVDEILKICEIEKVDILMPFMSQELSIFQKRKQDFKRIETIVSISENNSMEIANNKFRFYTFLKNSGFDVPKFCAVNSVKDLDAAATYLGYPENAFCIKTTESSGSRGVRIIDINKSRFALLFQEKPNSLYISMEELKKTLSEKDEIPEMMAMEFLPGNEMSIDILADKGKILYMCGRDSNVISASIPLEATLRMDERAYDICRNVASILKIDGNADFDFKYDIKGNPVLMEINPRIAATMAVFMAGGLNLPYLRIKHLLRETLPEIEINYGVKMKRRYLEMFVDADGEAINI